MAVDDGFVRTVLDDGLIPVVSSVARGEDGLTYNLNADTAAAALAVQLAARQAGGADRRARVCTPTGRTVDRVISEITRSGPADDGPYPRRPG